ncbi:ribosomal protection-like ABC-F family protein [Miniphocaeibacter massiliensis]|uniref:ribosomal protection-like ABC-F family protein n=1 Tax=Miniphocaeibacter massiliensis TaxID=2041841 RepID=UPI000C078A5F|nr:ABC-F family ATP-binding cassette domain-containing protein [Miniphocaeibacter massiliensis]
MILIGANGVTKAYVTEEILKDVTFNIQTGDKIGLIGVNGAGKTTLLDILNEELSIDSGEIYKQKDLKIGYLKQTTDLNLEETLFNECLKVFSKVLKLEKEIRELELQMSRIAGEELSEVLEKYQKLQDKFNELDGYEYNSRIHGMLKGLGFKEDEFNMHIKYFSGGQKSRVQLAKLLLSRPDILFLDEPTNHLDLDAIEFLQGFLRDYNGAVLIISHDRYFLDKIANKILLLENKKIETYNCGYSKYTIQREKDLKMRMAAYENQQKEIKRQQEIIERFSNYGSARLIKQSQSRKKLLEKMQVLEEPASVSGKFSLKFNPSVESGKDVLQIDNLSKKFDDSLLFENVNIDIYKGEKVGLIGPNGIGKTTLFKMILGKVGANEGSIRLGSQVKVGYYDQEQQNLDENNTILDEIWNEYPKLTHYDIRNYLARFLFVGDDIFKEISELSGGEKARVSLLKLMLSSTNFLLMDEPTNHLDIDSKEVLENALTDYNGTCFIISHDRYFLNKVLDKIIVLNKNGTVTYLGNYDYYLQKINESKDEKEIFEISKTQLAKDKKKQRELEKLKSKIKKQINELEKEIEKVEKELEYLNSIASDPTIYDDNEKMVKLFKDIENKEKEKEELYDKWLELQE